MAKQRDGEGKARVNISLISGDTNKPFSFL